jgi:hypothetical protein
MGPLGEDRVSKIRIVCSPLTPPSPREGRGEGVRGRAHKCRAARTAFHQRSSVAAVVTGHWKETLK